MKIVFFGTPQYAATILKDLVGFCHRAKTSRIGPVRIERVVTRPDKPAGRDLKLRSSPVKQLALKHQLPVIDTPKMVEIVDQVKQVKPDLIILSAYMRLLPAELLKIPRFGGLNVHPSLLPKYAGVSPIQQVILNGEKETGVTIILMNERYDEGQIISQQVMQLQGDETTPCLEKRLAELGGQLLVKTIPDWVQGKITPQPQDPKIVRRFYTPKLTRAHGYLAWQDINQACRGASPELAIKIERKVRAFTPWPGVWTKLGSEPVNKRLKILKTHLDGDRLVIDRVQLEGKNPITWPEFVAGYKPTEPF